MAASQDIHKARRNGSGSGQFVDGKPMSAKKLVDILVEGSKKGRHAASRRAANSLLEWMSTTKWKVTAGPHQGGRGGKGTPPDETTHVTVRVGRRSCHVRLDKKGHMFQILGLRSQTVPPWLAPGAAPPEEEEGKG